MGSPEAIAFTKVLRDKCGIDLEEEQEETAPTASIREMKIKMPKSLMQ